MMSMLILLLLSILLHSAVLSEAGEFQTQLAYDYNTTNGTYTNDSTYKVNLDTLLTNITSKTNIDYGFYNISVGQEPNQVNGIVLCRGDASISDCRSCLKTAVDESSMYSHNHKDFIVWYPSCMLRYSNRSIYGQMEFLPSAWRNNTNSINVSASDATHFKKTRETLLEKLKNDATNSRRKFALGSETFTTFQKVYGLVQCTQDLSVDDCYNCLDKAIGSIPLCCGDYNCLGSGQLACDEYNNGMVLYPSCSIRYDTARFYNALADPPSTASPVQQKRDGKGGGTLKFPIIVVLTLATATSILLIVLVVVCFFYQTGLKKRQFQTLYENESESSVECLQFNFETIKEATDNFSESNKLGQGGFGAVYKGVLSNGKEVAVKRLAKHSEQGEVEFKNEVLLVAKLHHRNLARLFGFCLEDDERLLIYEFVPNASLDKFLFDERKRTNLNWQVRHKIIVGIARGLLYLHEDSQLRIIHRDVKASNILLDSEMNPKISDFGMARLFQVDQSHTDTKRIAGTFGYIAPEYALHGLISVKSDVYSFGVMILEILTGQRNSGVCSSQTVENLITKMWSDWLEGRALSIIDPTIDCSDSEITRCVHIGLLCVQENAAERPTMSGIVLMLSSHSVTLPLPSRPPYVVSRDKSAKPQHNLEAASYSIPKESGESITVLYPR